MDRNLNDCLNTLRKALHNFDKDTALKSIQENHANNLGHIMPIIISQLNESVQAANFELFNCSELVLKAIVEKYDPEEVLLNIIDDIESAVDDTAFLTLTFALLPILLRLPKKRLSSLGWGLNAVSSYYNKIPPPDCYYLEEDKEILMDADIPSDRIMHLTSSLLPFYKNLIDNLSENFEERMTLLKFTLQLLGSPFAFLDLKTGRTLSKARRISKIIIEMLFEIDVDIYHILNLDPFYDIGEINTLALAILFYLVLVENVEIDKVPYVYDSIYIFQECLHLVTELLNYDQFALHNGLRLLETLLDRVAGRTLIHQLLDSENHSKFCKALTHVIVFNQLEGMRKKALNLYKRYLFCFDTRGRYLLVYNLMTILNHTGIIGYTITQYKDMMIEELNKPELSSYFSGDNLVCLLNRFCYLHKQEESDLLELSDQIFSAINLLRFLAIRDKKNQTGIYDHFKILQKEYLDPLKKGLVLSRAHYDLKIKDVKTEFGDTQVSITVAGQTLPELPPNEKLKCLYAALTTFDMIENLLSHLNEIICK